jgi:hypothetical protein
MRRPFGYSSRVPTLALTTRKFSSAETEICSLPKTCKQSRWINDDSAGQFAEAYREDRNPSPISREIMIAISEQAGKGLFVSDLDLKQ